MVIITGAGTTAEVIPEMWVSAMSRNQCMEKMKLALHKRIGGTMYRNADSTGLDGFFIRKFLLGNDRVAANISHVLVCVKSHKVTGWRGGF